MYDLILDNPWETEQDKLETLYLLLDVPKPYRLHLFSLTFYPGTALYDRAKREGLVWDEHEQVYRKHYLENEDTYLNGLFGLFQSQNAPRWLMKLLLSRPMRHLDWPWLPAFINKQLCQIQRLRARVGALLRRQGAPT